MNENAKSRNDSPDSRNESGQTVNGTAFAGNQVELAALLGISRRTLTRHAKRLGAPRPRADGRHEVAAWRVFLAASGTITDEDSGEALARAKARQLDLQNEKLALHIAIARRDRIPAAEVERIGAALGHAVRSVVSRLHLAAPTLEGLAVPEIERELKRIEDEVMRELHSLPEMIERTHAAPPA